MKNFKVDDLYLFRNIESLDGSAEHGKCIFLKSRPKRGKDSYDYSAWLLRADKTQRPHRLTSPWADIRSPSLDPGGNTLAFLSKRDGEDHGQVQLLPVEGGDPRELTRTKDELTKLSMWSKDGANVLLSVKTPWAEDEFDDIKIPKSSRPVVVRSLPYKLDGIGETAGYRTCVVSADTKSGEMSTLVKGNFDVSEACWSPDGESLAWVRNRDGTQRHRRDLWVGDADGNHGKQITHDVQSPSGIRWSPDGRMIAFGGSLAEGDSLSQLWLCTVASGDVRRATNNDLQLEGDKIVWHPDGSRIATIAARHGLHEVVVIDLPSGNLTSCMRGLRHAADLTISGDRLIFTAASARSAVELFSVAWDGMDERRHSRFNRKWFKERQLPRISKRSFAVPDGKGGTESIEAWLMLPTEDTGPCPLLVDFHGGPQSVALIDFPSTVHRYELCSKGWAILMPNAVGSGSYGTEFASRLSGHWGEMDFPQILAIIDQLQSDGIVDTRLACTGKSYGGYLSAWAIGNTSRFLAAVVSAPVANIESHAGTSDTGYYVTPYAMGGELPEVWQRYHDLSPTTYCGKSDTPTLLLQAADDERCPLGQSEELFAGLVRSGKSSNTMVVYPEGGHAMASTGKPNLRRDYHGRIVAWIQEHAGESR